MKKCHLFLSLFLLLGANTLLAQNDTLYVIKAGKVINKQSIKAADIDSIVFYKPILKSQASIGNQVWTIKNLDVTTYRDGTPIPEVTDPTQWSNLTSGAWCYYNNESVNGRIYGKLYNWYAVAGIYDAASLANQSLRKQLAPVGWHVPSDTEWTTLTNFLGGESVAGGKMKDAGLTYWDSPNVSATNESGFTGIPGGYRNDDGTFDGLGSHAFWWSTKESSATESFYRYLYYNFGDAGSYFNLNVFGFSVRCIKD